MKSRRNFLKISAMFMAIPVLLKTFAESAYAAGAELIDMTEKKRKDPANAAAVKTAKGLGYVADAKEGSRADKPGAGGKVVKSAEQFCNTCQLFTGEIKGDKPGPCMVIPGVLVHPKGSCNSWMLNAKVAAAK